MPNESESFFKLWPADCWTGLTVKDCLVEGWGRWNSGGDTFVIYTLSICGNNGRQRGPLTFVRVAVDVVGRFRGGKCRQGAGGAIMIGRQGARWGPSSERSSVVRPSAQRNGVRRRV